MKRILAILPIALIVGIVLVGCTPAVTPAPTPVLAIDTPVMGLVGYQLTAKLDSSAVSAVYSSTDTNVSVTASGLVTPLSGTGTAVVTATYQSATATYNVPLVAVGLAGTTWAAGSMQIQFSGTSLNGGIVSSNGGFNSAAWYLKDGALVDASGTALTVQAPTNPYPTTVTENIAYTAAGILLSGGQLPSGGVTFIKQ